MIPLIGSKNFADCGGVEAPISYANASVSEGRKSLLFVRDEDINLEHTMKVNGDPNNFTFFASFKLTSLPSINGRSMEIFATDYAESDNVYSHIFLDSSDHLAFKCGDLGMRIQTEAAFRDPAAWYSIMVVRNGSNLKIWLNGKLATTTTSSVANQSVNPFNKAGYKMVLGDAPDVYTSSTVTFDGLMTMVGLHDGVAHADMSAFGEFDANTGQWVPKDPDTTGWTDNSFYLSGKENSSDDFCNLLKIAGNGMNRNINNISKDGVDFVVFNPANNSTDLWVYDSTRGDDHRFKMNSNTEDFVSTDSLSFIDGGISLGSLANVNPSGASILALTLKKRPKSFDITEFTTNGDNNNLYIPHSLAVVPKMAWLKKKNGTEDWLCWVDGGTSDAETISVNRNGPITTSGLIWNSSQTTATEFSFDGNFNDTAGNEYVLYLFGSEDEFSHISYDELIGTEFTTELNFRPKVVIWKEATTSSNDWRMAYDITEDGCKIVELNTTAVMITSSTLRLSPSGKGIVRTSNTSNPDWITMAFADNTYLNDFAESDFGSIVFDSSDFPSWDYQYSDSPLNNRPVFTPIAPETVARGMGNLLVRTHSLSANRDTANHGCTFYVSENTGIYYAEIYVTRRVASDSATGNNNYIGVMTANTKGLVAGVTNTYTIWTSSDLTKGDTLSAIINTDENTLTVKNLRTGLVKTEPFTIPPELITIYANDGDSTSYMEAIFNFGQKPFLDPPAGVIEKDWKTFSSAGLVDTYPIINPKYFHDTFEWSGNGLDGREIFTDLVTPDLVLIKCLTDDTKWIVFGNSIGYTSTDFFDGLDTSALNVTDTNIVSTATGNRFIIGSSDSVNKVGDKYIAYVFKNSVCSGVVIQSGNTANIVDYPNSDMCLRKDYNDVGNWEANSPTDVFSNYLKLNTTDLPSSQSVPETLTSELRIDFFKVAGFLDIGVYGGNGSTDGTLTYTGFTSGMLIRKRLSTAAGNWGICDAKNNVGNPCTKEVILNQTNALSTASDVDILSNGFKNRHTSQRNSSSQDYIYIAFAESPFGLSPAR